MTNIRSACQCVADLLTSALGTWLIWLCLMSMVSQYRSIIFTTTMLVSSNECWRFWNWNLIKNSRLKFFETLHWSWILVKILRLWFGQFFEAEFWGQSFVKILKMKFGRDFEAEMWLTFWSRVLITLCYDIKLPLWWERLTRCALVMFTNYDDAWF